MAMTVADPFVSLRHWSLALYRGDVASIDKFMDAIDARLPAGWIRDWDYERTRTQYDRIRCYLFDQLGDTAVRCGSRG
jgi:hypothetical protein